MTHTTEHRTQNAEHTPQNTKQKSIGPGKCYVILLTVVKRSWQYEKEFKYIKM